MGFQTRNEPLTMNENDTVLYGNICDVHGLWDPHAGAVYSGYVDPRLDYLIKGDLPSTGKIQYLIAYDYITLPLRIGYHHSFGRRWSASLGAGASLNYMIFDATRRYLDAGNAYLFGGGKSNQFWYKHDFFYNKMMYAAEATLDAGYWLSDHFGLHLRAAFCYFTGNELQDETLNEHLYRSECSLQVRYLFTWEN